MFRSATLPGYKVTGHLRSPNVDIQSMFAHLMLSPGDELFAIQK